MGGAKTTIIVQAGGKGTRLEKLTLNKPKALVSVNNKPIIFYLFDKFPRCKFIIIGDYKFNVLEKYLKIFAKDVDYTLLQTTKNGTLSGISDALKLCDDGSRVILSWCDLILSENLNLPNNDENYIGISNDFECRWSFKDNKFIKEPSYEDGVAGFFIFKNKNELVNIPDSGEFVAFLSTLNIKFKRLNLQGSKEIGTMLSYEDINLNLKTRPFNSLIFEDSKAIKKPLNETGEKLAKNECLWYEHVNKFNYKNIPNIYSFKPLIMQKIMGKNIYEYDCLLYSQKLNIIKQIIESLKELHSLNGKQEVNINDVYDTYLNKTFDRINLVRELIPFAQNEFIKINKHYYKNPFFMKNEIKSAIDKIMPKYFTLIHGDPTFSNILYDNFNKKVIFIDPRGYFGKTKFFGDPSYDYAKLYYSLKENYDFFNLKKFSLEISDKEVNFAIKKGDFGDLEDEFFNLSSQNRYKIKLLCALIYLSLTTYANDDYDSICTSFYNGTILLNEALEQWF
ncbi:NTP transferase domain-containing protein [Campylobacter lanienae]|uniref:NTP transferase domain-containing protein n=2 Tax=Campylobacter TaxID=194 RepID=UPI000BB3FCAB|nr:NTP transferase domain-containing protein [Campylobacter lanienae]